MHFFIAICLLLLIAAIALSIRCQSYKVQMHKERQHLQKKLVALQRKKERLEQNLQKKQDIIQLIQKHMTESILILDDCDKIRLANDSAVELLKIDRSLLETHSIFTLTDYKPFLDVLRMTKKDGTARQLLNINGQDYRAYIRRVTLTDQNGTIILLIDVTDAVKAEKIRKEFTANVSHELKTPLTVIKGFGEMFGSGMIQDPEDVKKYGAMIQRESERLLFLMNDIIRLSEIEEHVETQWTPVDLHAVAEEVIRMLSDKAQQNQIQLIAECADVCIMGNENYIQELLINLIDNAVKYNNPGGWVRVSIQSEDKFAVLCVQDNGIGIPAAAQSRIFERFYRVDKSRSKERGGTGLGLSIVKHIVEYQKGTIALSSDLKKGTTITVRLPMEIQSNDGDSVKNPCL
ncbi:MAG: sensor histidine kinase [Ruminococcus sp.]